jgi:hypothetical protein
MKSPPQFFYVADSKSWANKHLDGNQNGELNLEVLRGFLCPP